MFLVPSPSPKRGNSMLLSLVFNKAAIMKDHQTPYSHAGRPIVFSWNPFLFIGASCISEDENNCKYFFWNINCLCSFVFLDRSKLAGWRNLRKGIFCWLLWFAIINSSNWDQESKTISAHLDRFLPWNSIIFKWCGEDMELFPLFCNSFCSIQGDESIVKL